MTACKHLNAYYSQLNQPQTDADFMRRAYLDLTSPYVWRVEVCQDCKSVIGTHGDVPKDQFPRGYRVLEAI